MGDTMPEEKENAVKPDKVAMETPKAEGLAHVKEAPKATHDKDAKPKVAAPKKKAPAKPTLAKPKATGRTNIGIEVRAPTKSCTDCNCPYHGRLSVRGQIFEGIVRSDKMDKSAVITRQRMVFVPKYERYMKRTSRMSVHSPPCIGAKMGDIVTVMECRPLSKTISFVIVSKKVDAKTVEE
jgi:small subunit ribosomal protein S17